MINIERALIEWLNGHPVDGLKATLDVPKDRPQRFIAVERVGGPTGTYVDRPLVSIQVWGKTRADASGAAIAVRDALVQFAVDTPSVGGVSVQSLINNPDPDSGQARYQLTVQIVTV